MQISSCYRKLIIGTMLPLLTACMLESSVIVYIDATDEAVFTSVKEDVKSFALLHGYDCQEYNSGGDKQGPLECNNMVAVKYGEASAYLGVEKLDENIWVGLEDYQPVMHALYPRLTKGQKRFQPTFLSFFSKYKEKYPMRTKVIYSDNSTKSVVIP